MELLDKNVVIGTTYHYVIESYTTTDSAFSGEIVITAQTVSYLYATDSNGFVTKIDPSGNQVWKIRPYTYIPRQTKLDHLGNIYTVYNNGYRKAYNTTDGVSINQRWSFNTGSESKSLYIDTFPNDHLPPKIYVVDDDWYLRVYDFDGNQVNYIRDTSALKSVVTDKDRNIYYSRYSTAVIKKLDESLNELWSVTTNGGFAKYMAIQGSTIFYITNANYMGAISVDGTIVNAGINIGTAVYQLAVYDTSIYVAAGATLKKYDTSLNLIWDKAVTPATINVVAVDVDESGEVYVGCSDGSTIRLKDDGTEVWNVKYFSGSIETVINDVVQEVTYIFSPFDGSENVVNTYTAKAIDVSSVVVKPVGETHFDVNSYTAIPLAQVVVKPISTSTNVIHSY